MSTHLNRRRALQTIFCSSAALALNLRLSAAEPVVDPAALHLLAIGDFGTTGEYQKKVASAMRTFVSDHAVKPEGLLLAGDNFYSKVKEGFSIKSERWTKGVEEMYPASHFPGPMWPVFGNHDYHDNPGGEQVQLEYARQPNVRWTMPAKWYRLDLGSPQPLVTVLAIDTNLPSVSGGIIKETGLPRPSLSKEEAARQRVWLMSELSKPRAPFTVVMGHHPLYSDGAHGDNRHIVREFGSLLEEHRVHLYLCGHDHDLQHLELEGRCTSFVLCGGGGARVREMRGKHAGPFAKDVYGFSHLQVTRDALTLTHRGIENGPLHRFVKRVDGTIELS